MQISVITRSVPLNYTDYRQSGTRRHLLVTRTTIDGFQSIPRESNDKDVAAMLVELTIEANEESFVIVLQHGGNDVTCKRSIDGIPAVEMQ